MPAPLFTFTPIVYGSIGSSADMNTKFGDLKTVLDAYAALINAGTSGLTQAQADLLYAAIVHSHTFASLTGKPTTLAGYGITDAAKNSGAQTLTGAIRLGITTLVSAANLIAVDLALNNNFKITLAQNNTLSAPTNAVEGQSGVITFTQDGTGSRTMAYNAFWDFQGAAGVLSTAAGAIDHLSYYVEPGAARAESSTQ